MTSRHIFTAGIPTRAMRMIKSVCLTALLLLACPAAMADDEIFSELSRMNQVESTYISSRFAHTMKTWYDKSYQHAMDLSGGFSSFYSYQLYSVDAVKKAESILQKYLKDNKDVELMMKSENGHQSYRVYEKFKDNDTVLQLIIWSMDAQNTGEIVVVNWKDGYTRKGNSSKRQ